MPLTCVQGPHLVLNDEGAELKAATRIIQTRGQNKTKNNCERSERKNSEFFYVIVVIIEEKKQ